MQAWPSCNMFVGLRAILFLNLMPQVACLPSHVGPSKYYKELDLAAFGKKVFQKEKDTMVLFYRGRSERSIVLNPFFERLAADVKKRSKHVDFYRVDEAQQGFPPKGKWPGLDKTSNPQPTESALGNAPGDGIAMATSLSENPILFYVNASSVKGEMLPPNLVANLDRKQDDDHYHALLAFVYVHSNWRVQRKLIKHKGLKKTVKKASSDAKTDL
mmetsp:Transcript_124106/g.241803  ORF Transcript_124106/g.241803 Transcript_124106/m.241803 type:complete len:215 (+) Transcript_124106:81-725(+)